MVSIESYNYIKVINVATEMNLSAVARKQDPQIHKRILNYTNRVDVNGY